MQQSKQVIFLEMIFVIILYAIFVTCFFQCRKYSVERHVFNDTVRGFHLLNINVILYGNENWSSESNMVLFRAVHR